MACRRLIFTSSDFLKACDSFDPLTGCPDRRPVFLALFFGFVFGIKLGRRWPLLNSRRFCRFWPVRKEKRGAFCVCLTPCCWGVGSFDGCLEPKQPILSYAFRFLCVPSLIRFPPCHLAPLVSGGLFLVQAEGDFSITSSVVFGSARDRTRHPPWQKNPARRSRVSAPC